MIPKLQKLLTAYKQGDLGDTTMPEDTHPKLETKEQKLLYYTLPMALNYQRDSFKLWDAAKLTWEDPATKDAFNLEFAMNSSDAELRTKLTKHKLALQPNKHIDTWKRISTIIYTEWGTIEGLIEATHDDYLVLREIVQKIYKKGFPYLSGPKIFNYWSYIIQEYADSPLQNRDQITIAPDTHVIQASIKLGVLSTEEANSFDRDQIAQRWSEVLEGSGIAPIDIHSPLWFWSRGGFKYKV